MYNVQEMVMELITKEMEILKDYVTVFFPLILIISLIFKIKKSNSNYSQQSNKFKLLCLYLPPTLFSLVSLIVFLI